MKRKSIEAQTSYLASESEGLTAVSPLVNENLGPPTSVEPSMSSTGMHEMLVIPEWILDI